MTADLNEIVEEIITALGSTLPTPVTITTDTSITRDLGLDSLAVMDFVMVLEDKFDVSIPLERIAEVETIGDLARTIQDLRGRA
ncbi:MULTISPECIES: acyl carrier protein [unclassified Azospirillum]|jgi:acyl carrier protein|uniref:acyl carrier protein n=1 Tax=unclassified Azospirillum TaxID=2630922 RepID=UPI000B643DFF|nr:MULTISPECIES: acyl carrier protein [unclassified Azospirillum]SNR96574.1 acyl carrier protein [Azospirillum sp. RU38E]SNS13518.1 acyl carrier protein [Azospirillum sp. RU37A]